MSEPVEIYQETGTPDVGWVRLPVTAEMAWRHLRDLLDTPLDSPAPEDGWAAYLVRIQDTEPDE